MPNKPPKYDPESARHHLRPNADASGLYLRTASQSNSIARSTSAVYSLCLRRCLFPGASGVSGSTRPSHGHEQGDRDLCGDRFLIRLRIVFRRSE